MIKALLLLQVLVIEKAMALRWLDLPLEKKSFHRPRLEEVAEVLQTGLKEHFAEVDVHVVDCPDLRDEPFSLAAPGLQGNPTLVEIGSPAYLLPLVDKSKIYDLGTMSRVLSINPAFIIGAGAGPFEYAGTNCEGIFNLYDKNGKIDQKTRISKVITSDDSPVQQTLGPSVTHMSLLGNFFVSSGEPGKVVMVHAMNRTGPIDFIASMRTALAEHYKSNIVGMGGTFLMKAGRAKTHVMPDFSTVPLNNDDDLNNWLNFYNMSAPLVAVGTFVTGEYELDLRVQHFHMFSKHGEAGHYHIDTTPDVVEYLGYFNIADAVYRIDKPTQVQNYGKD